MLREDLPRDAEAFFDHWRSARTREDIPTLSDYLDFPAFADQQNTAIVDVPSRGQMRFRLFGTGLNELSGSELTGHDVLSHFSSSAKKEAERITWSAVTKPCGYVLMRQMRRGSFEIAAQGIGLPLRHTQSGRLCIVGFTSDAGAGIPGGYGGQPFPSDANRLSMDLDRDQNNLQRKLDFINQAGQRGIYNPYVLQDAVSPYQVMAASIISASLITGINSDLPGNVVAQVTKNVFDTVSGKYLLIPKARVSSGLTTALLPSAKAVRCWCGSGSSFQMVHRFRSRIFLRPIRPATRS